MPRKIEISHRTIIFTFILLGTIWLTIQIRHILFLIYLSVIFMAALSPAVDKLQSLRLPRWVSITIIYAVILAIISTAIASIIPPLVEQTSNLILQLPSLSHNIKFINLDASNIASQLTEISKLPANIIRFTAEVFSNVIFVFTLAVVTFYLLVERRNLKHYLSLLFAGSDSEKRAEIFVDKLENQLGGWVRGELILMTAVGILCYLGLILLGIPYALPLAILAGLLEVIPTIGPIISAIPAVLAGLLISPYTAVAAGALYFIVQQTENSLLVPKIMQRATGVNPLVSLISLMIGFNLAGPGGAVLAIPTLLIVKIITSEFFSSRSS